MELIHYSSEEINTWRPTSYIQKDDYKPAGMWFSVEAPDEEGVIWGWKEWCEAEEFRLPTLKYRHKLSIHPSARLLILNTEEKMWAFTNQYAKSLDLGHAKLHYNYKTYVDWKAVARLYQGILIYPYFYQFRLGFSEFAWYYPWDCASGCIWDLSILTDFSLIKSA